MRIYTAKVKWALGTTELAVETTDADARTDLYTAAEVLTGSKAKTLRLVDVQRSNKRIVARMTPIARCYTADNGPWAWEGTHTR